MPWKRVDSVSVGPLPCAYPRHGLKTGASAPLFRIRRDPYPRTILFFLNGLSMESASACTIRANCSAGPSTRKSMRRPRGHSNPCLPDASTESTSRPTDFNASACGACLGTSSTFSFPCPCPSLYGEKRKKKEEKKRPQPLALAHQDIKFMLIPCCRHEGLTRRTDLSV